MKKWLWGFIFAGVCAVCYAQKPMRDVGIALYLNDITDIHAQEEIIDLEATVTLHWQSDRQYSTDRYFYDQQVDEVLKTMWWPYFKFMRTRGENVSIVKAMKISRDGSIDYTAKYSLSIETALDIHQFPFDEQTILITIVPFGYMPYQLKYYLLKDKMGIDPQAHIEEWKFTGFKNKLSSQDGTHYTLALHYQRKAAFYIYKIFLPLLMVVFISYMVLWLPKEPAINRLAVIITAMLTVVAFQWSILSDVPKVSYITYLQAMLLFSFITIASKAVFLVIEKAQKEEKKEQLVFWTKIFYPLLLLAGITMITWLWFG